MLISISISFVIHKSHSVSSWFLFVCFDEHLRRHVKPTFSIVELTYSSANELGIPSSLRQHGIHSCLNESAFVSNQIEQQTSLCNTLVQRAQKWNTDSTKQCAVVTRGVATLASLSFSAARNSDSHKDVNQSFTYCERNEVQYVCYENESTDRL
jgi:hypothetical protein